MTVSVESLLVLLHLLSEVGILGLVLKARHTLHVLCTCLHVPVYPLLLLLACCCIPIVLLFVAPIPNTAAENSRVQ